MHETELLTENEVIEGVSNYLLQKGKTTQKRVINISDAEKKEHGVDLVVKLENEKKNGNWYFIEAKGNKKSNGTPMKSSWSTNFRWAISQIVLRMDVDSRNNNYIYGIAVPKSNIQKCINLIKDNWALKHLKLRLYGAYRENGQLTATEYCPKDIYTKHKGKPSDRNCHHFSAQ